MTYIKQWFAIDLVAIMPFDLLIQGFSNKKANSLVRIARVGKLYKLVKLMRLVRILKILKQ